MQSNWCLFTSYDDGFRGVAALAVPPMRHYALQHKMDFAEHVNVRCSRPASWSKIDLAIEKFAEGYEYIFWVDADAVICRFDEDIRRLMTTEADIYFALEEVRPDKRRLNAGVWVLRNTPLTRAFLKDVREKDIYIHHKWWEQAAIISVLGLKSMFDDAEHDEDVPSPYIGRVQWLPKRWNCFAGLDRMVDPIVRHFIALDANGKEIAMRIDALLSKLAPERSIETEGEFLAITKLLWRTSVRPEHTKSPRRRMEPAPRSMSNFMRFLRGRPLKLPAV
jgi:hypothetical protein